MRGSIHLIVVIAIVAALGVGCWSQQDLPLGASNSDTDFDGDTDSDADSDADGDSDSDSDSDTDTNTAPDGFGPVADLCWIATFGSPGMERATDVVSFPDGSAIVAGHFQHSITFNRGEPDELLLEGELTSCDFQGFIARFDAEGRALWAWRLGPICYSPQPSYRLGGYQDGGAVVAAPITGTVTLCEGEPFETTLEGSALSDILVARFAQDSSLVWARSEEGDSISIVGIGVMPDGSVVTTGHVNQPAIFGEGEANETAIDSSGSSDRYVASYTPSGTLRWVKQEDGHDFYNSGVATTADGEPIVTGLLMGIAEFGVGGPNATELNPHELGPQGNEHALDSGMFVTRYYEYGELQWARGAGTVSSGQTVNGYPIGLQDNTFVVAGKFLGPLFFDYGLPTEGSLEGPYIDSGQGWNYYSPEFFAARFDEDGHLIWATQTDSEYGNNAEGVGAALIADNCFVVTGEIDGAVRFGPGESNETWIVSQGEHEPFAAVYDLDGNLEWAARVGTGWDVGQATAVAGLDDGDFLLAGGFAGSAEFLIDGEAITLESDGLRDGFLMKVCPSQE